MATGEFSSTPPTTYPPRGVFFIIASAERMLGGVASFLSWLPCWIFSKNMYIYKSKNMYFSWTWIGANLTVYWG
jgi:hypothetical protein